MRSVGHFPVVLGRISLLALVLSRCSLLNGGEGFWICGEDGGDFNCGSFHPIAP